MEMEMYFFDGVLMIALMALGASLAGLADKLCRTNCPALYRLAARIKRRHSGLFEGGDNFYCFFPKAALYGE